MASGRPGSWGFVQSTQASAGSWAERICSGKHLESQRMDWPHRGGRTQLDLACCTLQSLQCIAGVSS